MPFSTYEECVRNDAIVANSKSIGYDDQTIIVSLVNCKDALLRRIEELEAIAPRKMKGPNGKTLIWRCPDHLVPYNDFPTPQEQS